MFLPDNWPSRNRYLTKTGERPGYLHRLCTKHKVIFQHGKKKYNIFMFTCHASHLVTIVTVETSVISPPTQPYPSRTPQHHLSNTTKRELVFDGIYNNQ